MYGPASETGGVKPFSLQGRLYRERERLSGMTEEERRLRAQWVADQKICRFVRSKELDRELTNPIRRILGLPLQGVYLALKPVLGEKKAGVARSLVSATCFCVIFVYASCYYMKYNANDWTRKGGWRVVASKQALYSDEEGYPNKYDRLEPSDYASRGFKHSPI